MTKKAVGLLFTILLLSLTCMVRAEPSGSASTAIADIHTIDYVGNKIYEDGVLSRILVEGGYVDYNGGTPIYHAYLTDHQGNVGVVVDENATVKQVNHYYPYGALFAESTNSDVQPYKYNGKELDRMHGLDWYDHGARHNDAAIGRWHVMDPLCEKYYDVSPYAYCADDPVNAIDPDGKSIWTKMLKATMKIGSRVARNGLRELGKAATYADAISDIKENATTVVDGNASTLDRIGAGVSLASELLPISVGDVKDVVGSIKRIKSNGGFSAQHGGINHNNHLDKYIQVLQNDKSVSEIRKNQVQVDVNGNVVGRNRPDIQYNKNGKHHNVEFDNKQSTSDKHRKVINNNDPNSNNSFIIIKKEKYDR